MRYNWVEIDESVAEILRLNYNVYLEFLKEPRKLAFVKQLKEDSGLGLKEAKDIADIIFPGGVEMFKNTFGIKEIRRNKLDALKKRLITNELVEYIKKSNVDKLDSVFSTLDIGVIETVLDAFLDD